jgi:hypothetical protein
VCGGGGGVLVGVGEAETAMLAGGRTRLAASSQERTRRVTAAHLLWCPARSSLRPRAVFQRKAPRSQSPST